MARKILTRDIRGFRKPAKPVIDFTHPLSLGRSLCAPLGDSLAKGVKEIVSGWNGTYDLSTVAYAPSHHGGMATLFNGTLQSAVFPVPASYQSSSYGTWSTWVKSSVTANYYIILSRADQTSSQNGIVLFMDNGTGNLRVQIRGGGGTVVDISAGPSLGDGKWHNVVITFSPSGGPTTLYVDGASIATANASGAWGFVSTSFIVAQALDPFWGQFNGAQDNVNIWDRVLSASEIRALYAEPYAGIYNAGTPYFVGTATAPSTTPWQSLVQDNQPQPDTRVAVAI